MPNKNNTAAKTMRFRIERQANREYAVIEVKRVKGGWERIVRQAGLTFDEAQRLFDGLEDGDRPTPKRRYAGSY